MRSSECRFVALSIAVFLTASSAVAQTPAEVTNVVFGDTENVAWDPVTGSDHYNVYRGPLSGLDGSDPARCHGFENLTSTFFAAGAPAPGEGFVYLVTAESTLDGEGTPGFDSTAAERPLRGNCTPVMRSHVLRRAGFGQDDWSRDRIASLGIDGYIAEQLAPSTIDETTNASLNGRLSLYDPPLDIIQLIARQMVTSVYARRQLEQQIATFWANHFNTYWAKVAELYQTAYPNCDGGLPQCDANFPAVAYYEASKAQLDELEAFRSLSFGGTFRQIAEASALSPAMILYLDTFANLAQAPNENYARELLELYTMGVDGGYTQTDVEELARVLSGWTICKKKASVVDDPLAECIADYWLPSPVGAWTADFRSENHDCGAKTLFAGEVHETVIPDTCATPDDGVNDLGLALDGIVAHPATGRFISTKILQRFITDQPDTALIDEIVAVWNDGTNPAGIGDLQAIFEAVLTHPAFVDPDRVGSKIKTPAEHFISGIRSVEGRTDGIGFILNSLVAAQHIPHYNTVPTGWPEDGGSWLDTTNTLERQNFGLYLTGLDEPDFGSNPITFLNDNGISTAAGNTEQIVDFIADVLFGGGWTPAERQAAIDFLNTDIDGTPSPYDDTRIRRVFAYIMGYPQFQEQ